MATKEEIKAKLLLALPHFRYAMKKAAEEGRAYVGILSVEPKGSGRILAKFEAPEFFEDLATLIDAPPYTDEDENRARAVEFLDKQGLRT